MAKKSWIARNENRKKTVEKYAEKRAALKEAGDYKALQKLPRNDTMKGNNIKLIKTCMVTNEVRYRSSISVYEL